MTVTPVRLVEAALFTAGKPMAVEELAEATHLKRDEIEAALKELHQDYSNRETALEVVKSGTKWAMATRAQYSDYTKMLAAAEIPRRVLKTLALIAFHQPIKQADLKDMVGSVVYDHVHELHERGMITARQDGITKILTTTDRFAEYFGIDATNRDEIRTELARRVGITLAPKDEKPAPDAEPPAGHEMPAAAAPEESVAKASL